MANIKGGAVSASNQNFFIGDNLHNFFAIGDFMKQRDFYAIGYFRNEGGFIINTKLFSSSGKLIAEVKKNVVDVEGDDLGEIKTIDTEDNHLLEINDKTGRTVLHAELTEKMPIVEIEGELYNKINQLIATANKEEGITIFQGPYVMGATKSGSLGIVVNCSDEEIKFIREFVRNNLP